MRDTTYPREGTETGYACWQIPKSQDTTYPREGTETDIATSYANLRAGHNLSPRGDGNNRIHHICGIRNDTTYPREGTETGRCRSLDYRRANDTTYPREGTETRGGLLLGRPDEWTQLIPARGRKPTHHNAHAHIGTTQLIPARGRKRFLGSLGFCWGRTQLIPARGRKLVLPCRLLRRLP